jgi:hypothetical protein
MQMVEASNSLINNTQQGNPADNLYFKLRCIINSYSSPAKTKRLFDYLIDD